MNAHVTAPTPTEKPPHSTSPGDDDGLQLDSDMRWQRREWRWQRVTTVVLVLLLAAAVFGAFGDGPLSEPTVTRGDLTVVHERFSRGEHTQRLEVAVDGKHSRDQDEVVVVVSDDFLAAARLTRVTPEPSRVVTRPHDVAFHFPIEGPGTPLRATFDLTSDGLEVVHGHVGLVDGTRVSVRQIHYP